MTYYTKEEWDYVVVDDSVDNEFLSFNNVQDFPELRYSTHFTSPASPRLVGKRVVTLEEYKARHITEDPDDDDVMKEPG